MRAASVDSNVCDRSHLRLARKQYAKASAGYGSEIDLIIAIDVSCIGEDGPAAYLVIGGRAKSAGAGAQQNTHRVIAVVGGDDIELAVAIEVPDRQVVRAGVRHVIGHRRLEAGRRGAFVNQDIDGVSQEHWWLPDPGIHLR